MQDLPVQQCQDGVQDRELPRTELLRSCKGQGSMLQSLRWYVYVYLVVYLFIYSGFENINNKKATKDRNV